ncbi:MAG: prepilin-type N-terminal cleavage/methylation domain-containing protein [Planctomycetota bacterium]|nr:prepilin-type N-terminal cleavage/methylation domain-containing protein [Planctomycetota bacterium]
MRVQHRRAGYTLVEVLIAIAILVLLSVNIAMLLRAGRAAAVTGTLNARMSNELNQTVDRISLALMGADAAALDGPQLKPLSSEYVRFQACLGVEASGVIHGPLEEIQWHPTSGDSGRILWRENPSSEEERRVVWSTAVPSSYMHEIPDNGLDDNGNAIDDEAGLAFTMDGPRVDIHVTIERLGHDGRPLPMQRTQHVFCRN